MAHQWATKLSQSTTFSGAANGGLQLLWGPKRLHTHFYYLGIHFPITQDICYTGLSGRIFFCVIWAPSEGTFCKGTNHTHTLICPGIHFPITRTSVTQKNGLRIISVIISGLIVQFWLRPRNAKGSRNAWVIKFHGRLGCWSVTL